MGKYNRILSYFITVFMVLSLASCSSSGGGGISTGDSNPVAPGSGASGGIAMTSNNAPQVGETFTITVSLENESNLKIASYDLSYDPAIVELTDTPLESVTDGELFSADPSVGLDSSIDDNGHKHLVLAFNNGDFSPYSGSGTIFTVSFIALKQGDPMFSFSNTATIYYYTDNSDKVPLITVEIVDVQP